MERTPASRVDRVLRVSLGLYATVVFALLWVGLAVALTSSTVRPEETWGWLREQPLVPQAALWVLFLPVAVGLWAWQADLSPVVGFLVGAALVAWTLVAVTGLVGTLRRILQGR